MLDFEHEMKLLDTERVFCTVSTENIYVSNRLHLGSKELFSDPVANKAMSNSVQIDFSELRHVAKGDYNLNLAIDLCTKANLPPDHHLVNQIISWKYQDMFEALLARTYLNNISSKSYSSLESCLM